MSLRVKGDLRLSPNRTNPTHYYGRIDGRELTDSTLTNNMEMLGQYSLTYVCTTGYGTLDTYSTYRAGLPLNGKIIGIGRDIFASSQALSPGFTFCFSTMANGEAAARVVDFWRETIL
jgi:hypothetical protein